MNKLKQALTQVQKQKITKITKKSYQKNKDDPNKDKIYNIEYKYTLNIPKKFNKIIVAKSKEEATQKARNQIKGLDPSMLLKMQNDDSVNITYTRAQQTSIKIQPQFNITNTQRILLKELTNNKIVFKIYGQYSYYKFMNKPKSIPHYNYNYSINRLSVEALLNKGLIIREGREELTQKELEVQEALGSLPTNNIYILNKELIKKMKIKL